MRLIRVPIARSAQRMPLDARRPRAVLPITPGSAAGPSAVLCQCLCHCQWNGAIRPMLCIGKTPVPKNAMNHVMHMTSYECLLMPAWAGLGLLSAR